MSERVVSPHLASMHGRRQIGSEVQVPEQCRLAIHLVYLVSTTIAE
jgi:hypothetical protein